MKPLTLIVLLPLLGFLLNGLLGNRLGKRFVSVAGCALPAIAFFITVKCFLDLRANDTAVIEAVFTWATVAGKPFEIAFAFDRLAAVMTLIVTGVGTLIHIYSIGYMKEDASYARYFAYLNLFLFFMLLLVLGRSLLVVFVGWEGVGLASYLLIGFWFEDAEKAAAGKKAFITNRIGDAGFLLGMFLAWHAFGTFDFDKINAAYTGGATPALSASLLGILLFIGACGKSAQIPLHVWLPDAMAGPTPVSALIHAATMVTGGVYLVARLNGVYLSAEAASQVIVVVGAATAFFSATIAIAQNDIKKVLAYSTLSQLGFMFVALGVGAYGVAIFHVTTHAFFKACLFLGSGSVIHALHGEQDIRKMGGLGRKIPITAITFGIATLAIAGIPPLSGFFSKDEILWFALASERGGSPLLWLVMATTALITAFYMTRLYWLTFLGGSRVDPAKAPHIHESPPSMSVVLIVLAVLSAAGGFLAIPHWLEPVMPMPGVRHALHHLETPLIYVSVAIAAVGIALAAYFYGNNAARANAIGPRLEGIQRVLAGKYFVDEFYVRFLGNPLTWISDRVFLRFGDRLVIDGTLNGMAAIAQRCAGVLGRFQSGSLQRYVLLVLAGSAACVLWSLGNA